jgi:hypothetical protein
MDKAKAPARSKKLTNNEIEAANRGEATALLIRAGYRVYRPEADCDGEDLIVRMPGGELRAVQLKGRPEVDWKRYGKGRSLWMLFPDRNSGGLDRKWFLIPHDQFYGWVKARHGHAKGWKEAWSFPTISRQLRKFLDKFTVTVPRLSNER